MTEPGTPRADVRALRNRYRQLAREHAELKLRVQEYAARRYLSPGEELEMKTLQRMKLLKKDMLHEIERQISALEDAREAV